MDISTLSTAQNIPSLDEAIDDYPDPVIFYSAERKPYKLNDVAIAAFPDPRGIEGIDALVAEAIENGRTRGIVVYGEDFHDASVRRLKDGSVAASFRRAGSCETRIYILEEELSKRNLLSKEIHHRIKNNLQVVSSLLSLQEEYLRDPADAEYFRSSQDRIVSMALIHEQLYRTDSSITVEADSYLEALTGRLESSYGEGYVRLSCSAEKLLLEYRQAMPLGLIVNELATNAFKHAFPDKQGGRIEIRFARVRSEYRLEVADDGAGFPRNFDPSHSSGLGMQIVSSLVSQLHGRLEFSRSKGSIFSVCFPVAGK